ncbi:hypothetical protein DRQ53_00180 [bacterium]|nr:MAG: hypothetical protein DRQ53_00180 [bacterium]
MSPLPSSLWRTLSLQASFNRVGMQRSGWLVCLAPWLRRRGPERAREFMARPRAVFNTNPYLAPVLLGARCRIEEDHSAELADRVETTMQRTLGSLGDALVWRGVRPVWFLSTALLGLAFGPKLVLVAWLFFALAVCTAHSAGLAWGWRHGLGVIDRLDGLRLHAAATAGKRVAAILAGAMATGTVAWVVDGVAMDQALIAPLIASLIALLIGLVVAKMKGAPEWVLIISMVGLLLYARLSGSIPEAVMSSWR